MKTVPRFGRFALVGALGMGVQLAALALLNRWMAGRYLVASAAAIELAVLHNFLWHLHYTWRDRRDDTTRTQQLLRFHLSNGLVSMLGNLALMRLLVGHAHLPLLAANIVAIACCGAANFALADVWAFTPRTVAKARLPRSIPVALMILLIGAVSVSAQTVPQTSAAAQDDYGVDCAYENIFVGPTAPVGGGSPTPSFTAGVTFGMYAATPANKGLRAAPQFELGVVGPLTGGYPLDGLASVDWMLASRLRRHDIFPNLTVGYTRMFVTGNAVNFGVGVDFGKDISKRAYRVELRDYYLFTGPQQHVLGLRLGLGSLIAD